MITHTHTQELPTTFYILRNRLAVIRPLGDEWLLAERGKKIIAAEHRKWRVQTFKDAIKAFFPSWPQCLRHLTCATFHVEASTTKSH